MGDPKRIRKKFQKTKQMWNKQRIEEEHGIKDKYGLKNIRELWKATTEVRRIRKNVRDVLSGRSEKKIGDDVISRLARYNIVNSNATLDDLLSLTPDAILDRRLQSIIYKAGLARSIRQSRQLIAHGFISINGRKIKSPGYLVTKDEEKQIAYYKNIDLRPHENSVQPTVQNKAPTVEKETKSE